MRHKCRKPLTDSQWNTADGFCWIIKKKSESQKGGPQSLDCFDCCFGGTTWKNEISWSVVTVSMSQESRQIDCIYFAIIPYLWITLLIIGCKV